MRAMAALLVLIGSGCAMAQDSAPVLEPIKPDVYSFPWSPVPVRFVTVRQFSDSRKGKLAEAWRGGAVCSVKLLEMPMPRETKFTMRFTRPPEIDKGIFAKPPAPACP
jgi:hypothetical protein